jgi:hypothetical protein
MNPRRLTVAAVVVGTTAALVVSCSSSHPTHHGGAATSPTGAPVALPVRCALTGLPAPAGREPARPALGVKIGNDPSALPQTGLDYADIVFEEPIEGAITRLLAVFQCHTPPSVGPVRSTRWIDDQLMPMFHSDALAYAGGISFEEAMVPAAHIIDLSYTGVAAGAYSRSGNRVPPENLYASGRGLWQAANSNRPPRAVFSYSAQPPAGHPAGSIHLVFTSYYNVSWYWQAGAHDWTRVEYGAPDRLTDGHVVTATNIVVLRVATRPSPWPEDSSGEHGIESLTVGHGAALVLRNGRVITGIWRRANVHQPIQLVTKNGQRISLAPGNTWVELLPLTGSYSVG